MGISANWQAIVGSIESLWRYPIKSMMGEQLNAADLTERGLLGDRSRALVDVESGKVASAKNPRKWGTLFGFRASFVESPARNWSLPAVRITLPDGTVVRSDQEQVDQVLSETLGRRVRLASAPPSAPSLEEYWPNIDGLAYQERVTDEAILEGTFFDSGQIHLLTTATIDRLRELYPQGQFEVRRFRPNIVVEAGPGLTGFVENNWVGRTLGIGDEVRLTITGLCSRCVMTTLEQGDLPKDPGILRTAAQHNQASVGVYASILRGGTIRRGDPARLV